MSDRSTIGIKAYWTCSRCKKQAKTHQLAFPGQPPDPPEGWTIDGDAVICDEHGQRYNRVLLRRTA